MIEEIKEEILKLEQTGGLFSKEKGIISEPKVNVVEVLAILDKYNNQMFNSEVLERVIYKVEQHGYKVINNDEFSRFVQLLLKYKNAWEELKEPYKELLEKCNEYEEVEIISLMKSVLKGIVDRMASIEQKYNLGDNND